MDWMISPVSDFRMHEAGTTSRTCVLDRTEIADTTFEDACAQLLERFFAEMPDTAGSSVSVDDLILDAKILVVCEHMQHCKFGEKREVNLANLTDVLAEIVHARLFDEPAYSNRLEKLRGLFCQLPG